MTGRRVTPLRLGGLVASISGLLATAGCGGSRVGGSSFELSRYHTTWTVGSCHRLDQYSESDVLYASDTTPPVPCTAPHESETFAVVPITGVVARQTERPSPEWLATALHGACDQREMDRFLGESAPDADRNLVLMQVVPSATEWRAGVRELRCDVLIGPRTLASIASISASLKGILRTPAGARFRACRLGFTDTPCDGLHTEELVDPPVTFSQGELARGHDYLAERTEAACQAEAAAYLGAPLRTRPDLVLLPEVPGAYPDSGSDVGRCWIAPIDGKPVTGSVRRGGAGRTA